MKNHLKRFIVLGTIALGIFISCDNEDTSDADVLAAEEATITNEEIQLTDEADLIVEDITAIVEDVYATGEINATSRFPYNSDFLPECVTITTEVTDNSIERTVVFEGDCELPNGNILSGTIVLRHERDMEAAVKTINFSLENFSFNGVIVEGASSIVRTRENENGNPQSVANANFNATWPDGTDASLSGIRTREWIEGFGTGTFGDNVFLITGNRTFTNRNGITFEREIITPLRRELACRFIVSGVLQISRNETSVSLDFGDGNCDNIGVVTNAEGESREIRLRRFR